jgi:hypothetical protein
LTSHAPQLNLSIWNWGHGGLAQHMTSPLQQRHSPPMHWEVQVAQTRPHSPQLWTFVWRSTHSVGL